MTAMNKRREVHGGWLHALSAYRDSRMAKIFLLGFVSGFPWLLIGSMLSLWLKDEGLSRSGIGLFGIIFSVYAINALWSPVVAEVRIPFLSRRFGQRRAWIAAMQSIIAAAMFLLFLLPDAANYLVVVSGLIFIIAAASATQDIAIDALRIELIGKDEPEKVGPAAAMATSGWWLGFGGGKAFALPLVDALQNAGVDNAWQLAYLILIVVVFAATILILYYVEPPEEDNPQTAAADESAATADNLAAQNGRTPAGIVRRAAQLYAAPIASFVSRYTLQLGVLILMFVFFFKIGEAFLGRMSIIFYKEVGFSITEIGFFSGGLGALSVCVFSILGSTINARYGIFAGIIIGGIAMAATNLLFAGLAVHPEKWLFVTAVVADQFTTAISTVAFVAFLSQLCVRQYAATQYAALASLGNFARTSLAAASGFLVDGLGGDWPIFFVITTLMVLPSLAILFFNRRQLLPLMSR